MRRPANADDVAGLAPNKNCSPGAKKSYQSTPQKINNKSLANQAVDYLIARAFLAAYRERPYQRWIWLASLAARIAERGRA